MAATGQGSRAERGRGSADDARAQRGHTVLERHRTRGTSRHRGREGHGITIGARVGR